MGKEMSRPSHTMLGSRVNAAHHIVKSRSESDGAWGHPSRAAIFVGDLIDRGPKQLETVHLVRAMVESGGAQCVLGDHEFNVIAWVTPDPEDSRKFLRDHYGPISERAGSSNGRIGVRSWSLIRPTTSDFQQMARLVTNDGFNPANHASARCQMQRCGAAKALRLQDFGKTPELNRGIVLAV
jgi:hypothetical protein